MDTEATVLAFKQKISEKAGVAPELQRLIYKGRVMKEDQNTLASYSKSGRPQAAATRTKAWCISTPPFAASSVRQPHVVVSGRILREDVRQCSVLFSQVAGVIPSLPSYQLSPPIPSPSDFHRINSTKSFCSEQRSRRTARYTSSAPRRDQRLRHQRRQGAPRHRRPAPRRKRGG